MIIVNKCVKSHDSLGMISKVSEIYNKPAPSCPEFTKLPKYKDDKPLCRRTYGNLIKPKRRVFGLSVKSFNNYSDYTYALKIEQKYADIKELNELIKEQVNGGFSYDCECVFI